MDTEAQAIATAISYAEDRAMAGAFFPEWQTCADLLRVMCTDRGIDLQEKVV
jgi:hypothetical protein